MNRRETVLSGLAAWFAIGFLLGALTSGAERDHGRETGCVYKSIASFTNPGYIVGCELFRKRFEVRL